MRIKSTMIALLTTTILASPALLAATIPVPAPGPSICANTTINVTTGSAATALPSTSTLCPNVSAQYVTVLNDGSNEAFITFGGSTVVATTNNTAIPAGYSISQFVGTSGYIATITATSTTTLRVLRTNGELKYARTGSGSSPAVPSLAFTTLSGGTTSSTVPGSGSYAVAAPSGLTSATWGSGCSGASTVTGFSQSSGLWSATFSTPVAPCTGTLSVTGTGSNTASAVYPGTVTFTGSAPSCSNSLDFSDSCNSQYLVGVL